MICPWTHFVFPLEVPLPPEVVRGCQHVQENGSVGNDDEDDANQDGIEEGTTSVAFILLLGLVHPMVRILSLVPFSTDLLKTENCFLLLLLRPAGRSLPLERLPLLDQELFEARHRWDAAPILFVLRIFLKIPRNFFLKVIRKRTSLAWSTSFIR